MHRKIDLKLIRLQKRANLIYNANIRSVMNSEPELIKLLLN